MRTTAFRILTILCATAAFASAQTRGEDPFGEGRPDPKPKLSGFQLEAGALPESVRALQDQLSRQGLDPVNVVLEPGAEGMGTPELHFNAVTGHDALKLLAAAAGCEAEAILSDESEPNTSPRIIGYKLRQPQPTSITFGGPGGGIATLSGPGGRGTAKAVATRSATAAAEAAPAILGGPAQIAAPRPSSQAQVYALGTISPNVELGEIQDLIRSVLETSGVPQEDVRIMVHEKSNVLVVRAPEEAQVIVEQLLQSMTKNSVQNLESEAKRQAEAAERNSATMSVQNEMLQQRLAMQEAEAAALRDELERLRQQLQTQKQ